MAKVNTNTGYLCSNCGYETSRWLGQCPICKQWNTFEENFSELSETLKKTSKLVILDANKLDLKSMDRVSTGISEFDRVLGGGLVDSQVVLLSGQPGIGKSTILLQVLFNIVKQNNSCLYFTAEESAEQVALRAQRLFGSKNLDGLRIVSATEVGSILSEIKKEKVRFAIVDSIQTVFSEEARGLPGGVSQIKTSASKLVSFAKQNKLILIIVGQVTKEGIVAGPKLLEHLVDSVIELEGDEKRGLRVLRCLKNRYGSINEVGLFVMGENGLTEVADPSTLFSSPHDIESSVGVCKTAVIEGNRVLSFEIQALVVDSPYSLPKRVAEGIARSRLELLAAILSRHGGINLSDKDIYVNVSQGFKIKDPSSDLAIVAAMYSSVKKLPINQKTVAVGEVSLSGKVQSPPRIETVRSEISRLGYRPLVADFEKAYNLRQILLKLK